MFKKNPDSMLPEPTPERVYAVCKLLAMQPMTKREIQEYLSLSPQNSSSTTEINATVSVASEDLTLLTNQDGVFTLQESKGAHTSLLAFRRYVGDTVFQHTSSTFFQFTKWFLSKNEEVLSMGSWSDLAVSAKSDGVSLQENSVLGWRFWAAFLGFGYLNGTVMLPNMKIRIEDVLATKFQKTFSYGQEIPATDFLQWVQSAFPEVGIMPPMQLAFSAGLRTLHELGLITLAAQRDAHRVKLFPVDGDSLVDFSHITVWEAIAQ